mgnify:CR=1
MWMSMIVEVRIIFVCNTLKKTTRHSVNPLLFFHATRYPVPDWSQPAGFDGAG